VPREHIFAEGVNLTLELDVESGAFESEIESTDSREEAVDPWASAHSLGLF
jgi:hypothetical protein